MRVILLCLGLFSGWREGGVPVVEKPGNQWIEDVVSTPDGGVAILYIDGYEGVCKSHIQVIDSLGNKRFEEGVMVFRDVEYGEDEGDIEVDREGNYWVVVERFKGTVKENIDIQIQKVSPDGRLLLGDTGITVCNAEGNQRRPHLCISGDGVYVVWEDMRDSDSMACNVYMQRLNKDGIIQWNKEGIILGKSIYPDSKPNIVPSDNSTCIVGWRLNHWNEEDKMIYKFYFQKVNLEGIFLWGDSGIVINNANFSLAIPLIPDKENGVVVLYESEDTLIKANRINKEGELLWEDSGVLVGKGKYGGYGQLFSYSYVGGGGIYCLWDKNYPYANPSYWVNLVTLNGEVKFGEGIKVWEQPVVGRITGVLSKDIPGGLDICNNGIMVFESNKYDTLYPYEAYIQRVNNKGELWFNKIKLTDTPCSDGGGMYRVISASDGAIIVWVDCRNGDADIYAGKIDTLGNWVTGVKEREDVYRISFPLWFKDELEIGVRGGLVEVYDIGGRKVREMRGSGRMIWDGRDFNGKELPCGVYFIRIISDFGEYKGKVIKAR